MPPGKRPPVAQLFMAFESLASTFFALVVSSESTASALATMSSMRSLQEVGVGPAVGSVKVVYSG